MAATVIELLGGKVPDNWDGQSFADALRTSHSDGGREELVMGQAVWTCQRSIRFDDYIAIRTDHDGFHDHPQWMLFNVANDPHQQHDLAEAQPQLLQRAMQRLSAWRRCALAGRGPDADPMKTVLREGGPVLTRGRLQPYLKCFLAALHWPMRRGKAWQRRVN